MLLFPLNLSINLDIKILKPRRAIFIPKKFCDLILKKRKTILIDSSKENVSGEFIYICSKDVCGVFVLGTPKEISLKEFSELKSKHHISEEERIKQWGDKTLWAYPIKFIHTLNFPVRYGTSRKFKTQIVL